MRKKIPYDRMKSIIVLFITNRSIDPGAEVRARQTGKILQYEEVFLSRFARPVSYGYAEISYPTNRRVGDTNYAACSDQENPLHDFSIKSHAFVDSPEDFRELMTQYYPNNDASLLFIHGFNNSFSEAIERLAQLTLDLNFSGLPVLFSWPADAGRADPCDSTSALTVSAYKKATAFAVASRRYAAHVMDQLASASRPFEVLAHSMGTDLATNAIILRDATKNTKGKLLRPSGAARTSPRTLVLAAADISTKEFDATLRPKVIGPSRRVVVYCSNDRALWVSQFVNKSDERLGYCAAAKSTMAGVDLITVTGTISDFAHHSYFLNSAKILEDIRQVLAERTASSRLGGKREIRLP